MQSALEELIEVMQKEGFAGSMAIDEEVIGFSWGYKVPEENTTRVDFVAIRKQLELAKFDPEKAFYGADLGVKLLYRQQGLGTMLLANIGMHGYDAGVFRTKNPAMLRLMRKTYGQEALSFPEESAYKDGRVYVFKVEL
ncbi:GNAT family N-acetyltransferase [Candidatus Woesearchaeota archaeon]|nr:MAG: GNAT family N-acetyltransferase [Candidatus Woesearchaeota archaeon]